jgi:hypothetical protein
MVMLNETEIKKDLFKSKAMAKFNHYIAGNLYYNVEVFGEVYEFPISTIQEGPTFNDDESGLSMYEVETVILSEDLGTTRFESEIRGSELARWISKAIKNETFIKLG